MSKPVFCNFKDEISSGSRAQDALRAGFLITCQEGLAEILNVKDLTVEACKDFLPRATQDAEDYIRRSNDIRVSDKKKNNTFKNKIKNFYRYKILNYTPEIEGELFYEQPTLDIKDGRYSTIIKEKFPDGKIYGFTTVHTNAKAGRVVLENYDTYTKLMVPDHVIEDIKIATEIGLHDIKIAYPVIQNGKPIDPLVIGYIDTTMFLISRFDIGDKEYPTMPMTKCGV